MNRHQIEQLLKDYYWKMNSIKEMRKDLNEQPMSSNGLTSQYGDDSDMPKPQGGNSDPVYKEYIRRQKQWKNVYRYEVDIQRLQDIIYVIEDEREEEVLHWLLNGKSYRWIGKHMGLSFSHIKRIRDSIVEQLSDGTNGTNGTNDTDFYNHGKVC